MATRSRKQPPAMAQLPDTPDTLSPSLTAMPIKPSASKRPSGASAAPGASLTPTTATPSPLTPSSSRSGLRLPLELIFKIVESLAPNHPDAMPPPPWIAKYADTLQTLQACSLVDRAVGAVAQRVLFTHYLHLDIPQSCDCTNHKQPPDRHLRRNDKLASFHRNVVKQGATHLLQHVRGLYLTVPRDRTQRQQVLALFDAVGPRLERLTIEFSISLNSQPVPGAPPGVMAELQLSPERTLLRARIPRLPRLRDIVVLRDDHEADWLFVYPHHYLMFRQPGEPEPTNPSEIADKRRLQRPPVWWPSLRRIVAMDMSLGGETWRSLARIPNLEKVVNVWPWFWTIKRSRHRPDAVERRLAVCKSAYFEKYRQAAFVPAHKPPPELLLAIPFKPRPLNFHRRRLQEVDPENELRITVHPVTDFISTAVDFDEFVPVFDGSLWDWRGLDIENFDLPNDLDRIIRTEIMDVPESQEFDWDDFGNFIEEDMETDDDEGDLEEEDWDSESKATDDEWVTTDDEYADNDYVDEGLDDMSNEAGSSDLFMDAGSSMSSESESAQSPADAVAAVLTSAGAPLGPLLNPEDDDHDVRMSLGP